MKLCKAANSKALQGGFPDRTAVSPGSEWVWSSVVVAGCPRLEGPGTLPLNLSLT